MFQDKEALLDGAFELAAEIATKSPVAVQGTKINLLQARDHPVPDALDYVVRPPPPVQPVPLTPNRSPPPLALTPLPPQATWNMAMLQTEDILKSVQAAMEKKSPKDVVFSKL